MHIVYYCYGAAHSSIVAAAIHLGRLPSDRVPTQQEMIRLANFDQAETWELGSLFFKGHDENDNPVYVLGLGGEQGVALRALISFLEHVGLETSDMHFFQTLPSISRIAKIGGALSRRYGVVKWGRPMAAYGIRRRYSKMVKFVEEAKEQVKRQTSEVRS